MGKGDMLEEAVDGIQEAGVEDNDMEVEVVDMEVVDMEVEVDMEVVMEEDTEEVSFIAGIDILLNQIF